MSHTRESILRAALALFAREGYEAVSVSMIAGELGITKGALYRHYKNKRDIFDSIVRRMEEMDSARARQYDMPEAAIDQMSLAYRSATLERIKQYSLAQFDYWTRDEFCVNFRRMLTLEQYRKNEMAALYQQYLAGGPLGYIADLFGGMTGNAEEARRLALKFYAPLFLLYSVYDGGRDRDEIESLLRGHIDGFSGINKGGVTMEYPRSKKYDTPELISKIMGPNPIKLEEELLNDNAIPAGSRVCDLGSGQGLTSVFLVREYGFTVYAADLWSDPDENRCFFDQMGLSREQIIPVKADAMALPFEREFFDAVVSIDSYNYFGRDPDYLDQKLLPYVKKGGYIYIAIPGMRKDCHDDLPAELLLSWTPEQLDYMHDAAWWKNMVSRSRDAEVISVDQMQSDEEVWADWLKQDNPYAVEDRKSMEAGGGKYLNFIAIVLRKKEE